MRAHEQHLVEGDGGPFDVRLARETHDQAAAVHLLDEAERAAGVPLVDEAERHRLDRVAHHAADPHEHWHPLLATHDDHHGPVGYAGLLLPPQATTVSGDLVVATGAPHGTAAVLARAARELARQHGAGEVVVWIRHVAPRMIDVARGDAWTVRRRLSVLGRSGLDEVLDGGQRGAGLPDGVELQAWDGDHLDVPIVELLRAAYAETPDEGWTVEEFRSRRALPWFRAQDLLLARRGDDLLAVHWTKRRSATTGEVYNLAVAPRAWGQGLGAAMLDAGVRHLAEVGMTRIVLWVADDNEAGKALYASRGFQLLWQDVALARDTGAAGPG